LFFPPDGTITPEIAQVLGQLLPFPKPPKLEGAFEEVTLVDPAASSGSSRGSGRNAYDSDDEERHAGGTRMECAHQ